MAFQACGQPRTHNDYTVGWVCALPKEQTAATAMLKKHADLPKPPNDPNTYTLGSISHHNVVICCLPSGIYGQIQAAAAVSWMISAFPSIKFGLMVGIGGSIPTNDVRLGDVVVSQPVDNFPGVVQWDLGKAKDGGKFERRGALNIPPLSLLTALSKLKTKNEMMGSKIPTYVQELGKKWPRLAPNYVRSKSFKDVLFEADYSHVGQNAMHCGLSSEDDDHDSDKRHPCRFCDKTRIVKRSQRDMAVQFGLIVSGNKVIEDATVRDKLNRDLGGRVLCIEMEAAGLMNNFSCLVVRGICDYADSHKNDAWQEHAAAVAAAFAKELLECVQPSDVDHEQPAKGKIDKIHDCVSATARDVKSIRSGLGKQEELEILDWLTLTNYGSQQSDSLRRHQPGTGNPGAEKTILTSIVVHDLNKQFSKDAKVGIAYIYCKFGQQGEQTAEDLTASLVKQLAGKQPFLPQFVKELYDRYKVQGTRPLLDELSKALHSVSAIYSRIFVLVNALDECKISDGCRSIFLSAIFSLKLRKANIFATSRPIPEIAERFEGATTLPIHAREDDVRRYLDAQMFQLPHFIADSIEMQDEVKTAIIRSVDGMFLLAQLHLDLLIGQRSLASARTALKSLPTGSEAYNKAYENAMARVEGQNEKRAYLAKEVLLWITFAKRTLFARELQHALAVEVRKHKLDEENLPRVKDMISVCAGLVTVDETSSIIRLVHYTTQQYFERTHTKWFPNAENNISGICAAYLSFSVFGSGICETDARLEERLKFNPLYMYAACNWGHHARDASACPQTVIKLLEKKAQMEASIQVLMVSGIRLGGYSQRFQRQMTSLHLSAYFGVEKAAAVLLKTVKPNLEDSSRSTPLSYAAKNGHEAVVKLLLEHGASTCLRDSNGRTSLLWATLHDNIPAIALLVEHSASIVSMDVYGDTPLRWARINNSEPAAMLLLAKDIKLYSKLSSRLEMFFWAAENCHQNVLKLLLQNGVNIDCRQSITCMRSGLLKATKEGNEEAVRFYLEAGTNAHSSDFAGDTPLSIAAGRGSENMVQLLLKHGANVNLLVGRIPLMSAAFSGNQKMVKLLIEKGADVNFKDVYGRLPLMTAVKERHLAVVELLLKEGTNVDSEDGCGRRPLSQAAEIGCEEGVELLLRHSAIVNYKDQDGRTPLWRVAKGKHKGVAKLLLEYGADVNLEGIDGSTPLSMAIMNGRMDIVKLFLDHSAGSVSMNTDYGQRLLYWTVSNGDEKMMRLLLQKGRSVDSTCTEHSRTPLSWAAAEGKSEMVKLVLEKKAEVNLADSNGQTPLFWAAERGHDAVIKLLLKSDAEVNIAGSN
ncbi:uncharacterized protein KD926_005463, partial [Aspergillus affinis]|uniref:uncharacterized protein n=1 Tax=Aspergillus affinis TaxID=1070780 RepID=UPI0022FDC6F6